MKLRPIRRADAGRIQVLVEDPAVRRYTNMPEPYPPDGAERWIDDELAALAAGTGFAFAIVTADGPIGAIAVRDIGGEPPGGALGYWIGRPFWGRGHASEAVARLVRHAFEERGLEWLEASCLESHVASRRVLEKNGFRFLRLAPEDHPKWGPEDLFAHYRLNFSDAGAF